MTDRQTKILDSIVETYARTADPVGSQALSWQFGYSPATIRAEMADLERQGYITHPHTSSGRVPTDKGYRAYVNHLGSVTPPGRLTDVVAKRVSSAGDSAASVRTATETLAQLTHNAAWATLPGGLYLSGLTELLSQPEFFDSTRAREMARLLDHLDEWLMEAAPAEALSVYIGQENPVGKLSGCSLVIARFASPYSDRSYIGVVGPTRQSYQDVLGWVDYTGRLLEEALR